MNIQRVPTTTTNKSIMSTMPETHLYGYWLITARVVWGIAVVLTIGLFTVSLPTYFASLHVLNTSGTPPPQLTADDVHKLQAWGISLDFYAWFSIFVGIFFLLVCNSVGGLLFWHKSNDRLALVASLSLMLFPLVYNRAIVETLPPPWTLLTQWVEFLGDICLGLFLYLFPHGQFIPRWTRWLAVGWVVYWGLNIFFMQSATFDWLSFVLFLGLQVSLVTIQIYRYRHLSSSVQRQQTKWVVLGVIMGFGGYIIGGISLYILLPLFFPLSPLSYVIGQTLFSFMVLLFPLSIGIAILRYRLWDIDILINRTLVYGLLSATLLLTYLVLVFAGQALLSSLLGHNNGVVLVASTLIVAALFQPLRQRVQQLIDRRFYRRKYDAARTLAAFSTTLRNEVDLSQLSEQLVAVVQETMQPTHVSLWIRPLKWQASGGRIRAESSSPVEERSEATGFDS